MYFNRFRYYSPEDGIYTQPDPIGLLGNNPTLYGYVHNPLCEVDIFGLAGFLFRGDDFYRVGQSIGIPKSGTITADDIFNQIKATGDGRLTSFSEKLTSSNGSRGADFFGRTIKVSNVDIADLIASGDIAKFTQKDVTSILNDAGYTKSEINGVLDAMKKNNEVLIHGEIPSNKVRRTC